jgi:hypothetical protein
MLVHGCDIYDENNFIISLESHHWSFRKAREVKQVFCKTSDGGETWEIINGMNIDSTYIAFDTKLHYLSKDTILALANHIVYEDSIKNAKTNPERLYSVFLSKSVDGGKTWEKFENFPDGYTDINYPTDVIYSFGSDTIVVGTEWKILGTVDAGETWEEIGGSPSDSLKKGCRIKSLSPLSYKELLIAEMGSIIRYTDKPSSISAPLLQSKLYPNPAQTGEKIEIQFDTPLQNLENISVQIYDYTGKNGYKKRRYSYFRKQQYYFQYPKPNRHRCIYNFGLPRRKIISERKISN